MFGGPSSGKSTSAMELSSHLKWNKTLAEYVPEFAKELCWENRASVFNNQVYVFAKQHHSIYRLLGQVDVVITDSPIILSIIYNKTHPHLNEFILEEFKNFNNLNFYLHRTKEYVKIGRYQTEQEAHEIDTDIKVLLQKHDIPHVDIVAKEGVSIEMAHHVRSALNLL